jgi:hypothetical protein
MPASNDLAPWGFVPNVRIVVPHRQHQLAYKVDPSHGQPGRSTCVGPGVLTGPTAPGGGGRGVGLHSLSLIGLLPNTTRPPTPCKGTGVVWCLGVV